MLKTVLSGLFMMAALKAWPDSVSILDTSKLKTGSKTYLVYTEDKESGDIRNSMIWERNVSIEESKGNKVFVINQLWRSAGSQQRRTLHSISDFDSFKPIYHKTSNPKGEYAFNFNAGSILGDKTLPKNQVADFELRVESLPLNWELDMETFQMLNFSSEKVFNLFFYHPGSKTKPRFYQYKVIGSEIINHAGIDIDCWQLSIFYEKHNVHTTFWIDKKTQSTVKVVDKASEYTRYKYLLKS